MTLEQFERAVLAAKLQQNDGNRTLTADRRPLAAHHPTQDQRAHLPF